MTRVLGESLTDFYETHLVWQPKSIFSLDPYCMEIIISKFHPNPSDTAKDIPIFVEKTEILKMGTA